MKKTAQLGVALGMFLALAAGTNVWSARKKKAPAPPPVELTAKGKALQETYTKELEAVKADITKTLPVADGAKEAAYLKALEAEKPFEADRKAKERALNACKKTQDMVKRTQGTINKLPRNIAAAKEQLKKAEAFEGDAAAKAKMIKGAKSSLARKEAQLAKAKASLTKVIAAAAKAKAEEPKLAKTLKDAEKALAAVQAATMKTVIAKALPAVDQAKIDTYLKAIAAEKPLEEERDAKKGALSACQKEIGMVARTQKSIDKLPLSIKDAKSQLKKAEDFKGEAAAKEKMLNWAKANLAKREAQLAKAKADLPKFQEAAAKAKAEEPTLAKALENAEKALTEARAATIKAINELGVDELLSSPALDAKLAKYTILTEATPRGLAEFAQVSKENEMLVESLLSNGPLMMQMAVADGANGGKYGDAMRIYTSIQANSAKAKEGVFQKLALAIALEHAVPRGQRNATGKTDAPKTVDPVKRYRNYEKAYLAGELDPGFKDLDTWDYRFVVNGEEPDEVAAWGRKMLRNYRPDHVTTSDYRWRYVKSVKTEVRYGSQDNKYDQPDQQFFQNILKNGGICGRRAFFGRFILRAFGVPTTARPQPGHAALAHWTPDGWVVCLGAGWRWGSTRTRYRKDLDFLANTQARENRKDYLKVKRAQWIGDVVGEKPVYGFYGGRPEFWYNVSLFVQRGIIDEAKAVALAAVGTDIGEANESEVKDKVDEVVFTKADRTVVVGEDGTITIPAAACSRPSNNTDKIKFMKSNLGGMQLHYGRLSRSETFEYIVNAPKAGKYALTARVVTPSWKQHLFVRVSDVRQLIDIPLPYTVGMWDTTKPVVLTLEKGKNILLFSRDHENVKGVSVRDFTLKPVK